VVKPTRSVRRTSGFVLVGLSDVWNRWTLRNHPPRHVHLIWRPAHLPAKL